MACKQDWLLSSSELQVQFLAENWIQFLFHVFDKTDKELKQKVSIILQANALWWFDTLFKIFIIITISILQFIFSTYFLNWCVFKIKF